MVFYYMDVQFFSKYSIFRYIVSKFLLLSLLTFCRVLLLLYTFLNIFFKKYVERYLIFLRIKTDLGLFNCPTEGIYEFVLLTTVYGNTLFIVIVIIRIKVKMVFHYFNFYFFY